jgi:hypothetical protein
LGGFLFLDDIPPHSRPDRAREKSGDDLFPQLPETPARSPAWPIILFSLFRGQNKLENRGVASYDAGIFTVDE